MRLKVKKIVKEIAEGLNNIPCVEMVSMVNSELDIYDPYFSIQIDVFCTDVFPTVEDRLNVFSDGWIFETHLSSVIDNFLVGDLPVQINYSFTSTIDNLLKEWEEEDWIYNPGETYILYRLSNSELFFNRTGWAPKIRQQLEDLPAIFWSMLQISLLAQLDHCFGNMKAAELKEDELFFSVTLIAFLECYTAMMFAINEEFEPDIKHRFSDVQELEIIPEHFKTEYLGLFSVNQGYTMSRKLEVSKILLQTIAPMV